MNNLLSYCGLTDARMSAFEKDLPLFCDYFIYVCFIILANKANFKSAVGRALIGTRVITKYNNRTYCVDDIVWDKNPETTFPDRVSL